MVTGTNKREYSNSNFNSAETYNCHLSIETGDDFLCCAVHEAKTGILMAVDQEKPDYMDQAFQSVTCTVINPHFTLVPDAIYDKNVMGEYLKLNSSVRNNYSIHAHLIPSLQAWCIYGVEKEFETKLERKFPSVIHRHITALTIESVSGRIPAKGKVAVLNMFRDSFVLLIFNEGKLIFCNVFHYKVHEDIAYYLQFAAEQLKMAVSDLDVKLVGPFSHPVMMDFLKKFFVVSTLESAFSIQDYHNRYFTLINQLSCV